jgi:hypothetical protein
MTTPRIPTPTAKATDEPDLSFLDTPERQKLMEDSYSHHRQHPEVSIEEHIFSKCVELGKAVASKHRIYLDQKYWIYVRDAALGETRNAKHIRILELLNGLCRTGKAVCPLSETLWLELFKIPDMGRRRETAIVYDGLSSGVCLRFLYERIEAELYHFMCQRTGKAPPPLLRWVWTKCCFIIGTNYPAETAFDATTERVIQKAYTDDMWSMSLTDMLDVMHQSPGEPPRWMRDVSFLNEGKLQHADEIRSFRHMWLTELGGFIDVYGDLMHEFLLSWWTSETGNKPSDADKENRDPVQWFQNIIYHAFKTGQLTSELPTVNVKTGVHAMLRWDRERKYRPNDLDDLGHAACAVPYCDIFLTERSLKALLTSKPLRFHELYDTKIIADEDEAIALLASI